jgi:Uma2 family endonuclease
MLALGFGMDANDFGSVTLNCETVDRGIEPDTCFHSQNATKGQGLEENVTENLPPDLALEVDIASSSANKMQIYHYLGHNLIDCYASTESAPCHLVT